MRKNPEEQLDLFIDSLNNEQKPPQGLDSETASLFAVVRGVKNMRPQAEPRQTLGTNILTLLKRPRRRSSLLVPAAVLAAGFLLLTMFFTFTGQQDLVYAMEKAAASLTSYHGIVEVHAQNQAGENWLVRRTELWSAGDKYAILHDDGTRTVNNGQLRWQLRPQEKEAALLPLVPDPTRQGFDLKDEAKRAAQYPQTVVGEETVAGRLTTKLAVSPPGGQTYYLWVDNETKLPLQLQTAVQNALQTVYTFVSFEPNVNIEPNVFAFNPPNDYKIIDKDPGQQVSAVSEAAEISQFTPLLPKKPPTRIFAFSNRIVLDYGNTTIVETPAKGPFKPENYGALGKAAGGDLEIIGERLRWQQNGLEIVIEGAQRTALAQQIADDITLPEVNQDLVSKAQIKVPVDMAIVKADQKQVDGGHTPWQLDPLNVSLTFVNLQVTPAGIIWEPQIPESSFKLAEQSGAEAVVEVANGPVSRVYLKRLIRVDESGIWSVVGYDPR